MQISLVKFVKNDRADAFKEWVIQKLAGQNAFGDDMQSRIGADAFFEANLVADFVAQLPAIFIGDALGAGAGGHSPGLKHDQVGMLGRQQSGAENRRRNARRLPRARRSHEDQRSRLPRRRDNLQKVLVDR